MGAYRAQVVIPASTGIGKDNVVNAWGFYTLDTNSVAQAAIITNLRLFYDGWANYRSFLYNWPQAKLKLYHLVDPIPRVPIYDGLLGLNATVPTTTLPTEVALCLSFQAAHVSGQSQRRRRGRVYCGPLAQVAAVSSTGRPSGTVMTSLAASAESLRVGIGSTTVSWVVLSQPKQTDPITWAIVTGGWVDDAFDTQRRRGPASTTRTIFGT